MTRREKKIRQFFQQFTLLNNVALQQAADVDALASQYGACFLEANPLGVKCGLNNEKLRLDLLSMFATYREMGIAGIRAANLQIFYIDKHHSMVRIRWVLEDDTLQHPIRAGNVETVYVIQERSEGITIISTIINDEQKTLKTS